MPAVRTIHASEWRAYRAIRLRALSEAPEAFGSTLPAEPKTDNLTGPKLKEIRRALEE